MSKYTVKHYAMALHQAVFETHLKDQDKVIDRFAEILKENNDLHLLDEIEREFAVFERSQKNIVEAEVISARPLSSSEEENLIKELNKFAGSKVEIRKKVDEGLIGGVVVRLGDQLIDGSVKRELKDLKEKLTK